MGSERRNLGPGGSCVCPNCGYEFPHVTGKPCFQEVCPRCGFALNRVAILAGSTETSAFGVVGAFVAGMTLGIFLCWLKGQAERR